MKIPITLLSCLFVTACAQASAQTVAQTQSSPASVEGIAPVPAESVPVSQVRIVRLSQVKGQVEMDRKTGQAFEMAFANLPIVAGAAVRTKQGLAEVEFEDNSSLRLTPQSQVEFPRLGRDAAGSTLTAVTLLRGSLYVSLAGSKTGGDFTLKAGNETIVVSPSTHLRIDLDAPTARMVVFQGVATVTGPSGSVDVTKRKAISFDTASSAAPEFVHIGEAAAYDDWDKNAVDYHKFRASAVAAGFTGSPYLYGVNDLNYYGSFSDVGGCGMMWRPHLANAAFDPYGSGVWSWYPGQGYTWVSLYPWGWMPFHSGSWDYCPAGGGWGWRPQGTWRGLQNHPLLPVGGHVHGGPVRPTPPPAPVHGGATMIAVNLKSMRPSQQGEDGRFVLRAGSAGLGVPRGVFSNLAKLSQTAERHGAATAFLSEHQMQVGQMAPVHSSPNSSLSASSSAGHSSVARSGSTTASTSASSSFASSHSVSVSPVSTASFTSAPSASAGGSPASGAASHH
jgi:hypothetical protein